MRPVVVLLLLTLVAGCGDDGGGADAAADAPMDGAPIEVTPPGTVMPSALPVLTPCADGFRAVDFGDGIDVCEPWPETGRDDDCADHEAHFPGESGCARVGTACPADGLPEGVDASAIFVSAGATSGDGSRGAPFGTIGEALAAASPGDVVAVGVGTYDEALRYGDGIEVVGACAESTVIRSSDASMSAGVVTAAPGGTAISNVMIGPSERVGLWGATAGASFTVRDVVIREAKLAGINLESGASLGATGLVVRDPVPGDTGLYGRGLTVERGSTATVSRGVVSGTWEFAALALGEETTLTLDHVAFFDSVPRMSDDLAGVGIAATDGGRVVARAVVVEEATDVGVVALRGSTVEIEDSVIRDTRAHPIGDDHGRALDSETMSTIVARRTLLDRNRDIAVFVDGDADIEIYDVVVHDTASRGFDGRLGRGISAQNGGRLVGERVAILDNREVGVFAGRDEASIDIDDLLIARTMGNERDGSLGIGLLLQENAGGTIRRAVVEDNRVMGVGMISSGTVATLEDLIVRGTRSSSLGSRGRGLAIQTGVRLNVVRALIETNRDVGVFISDSELIGEDVLVTGVGPQECAETTCSTFPGGHGIGVYDDGVLEVQRYHLESADLCGIHLANGGIARRLVDGLVSDNAIGVCNQSPAQDLAALSRDTRFEDNGLALDTTMLPVPDAVEPIAVE